MKLEPVEPQWTSPEARELFESLMRLHDDVWQECRIALGDDMPEVATATEIASRQPQVRDTRRRAEIIEMYRRVAQPYADRAADVLAKHSVPQMILHKD